MLGLGGLRTIEFQSALPRGERHDDVFGYQERYAV